MKSWVKYSVCISLLVLIAFSGCYISGIIEDSDHYPVSINTLWIVFYGVMGLILGSEHLLREYKKDGIWKINMPKIIAMGIPSLYISLSSLIYYNHFVNTFLPSLIFPIRVMLSEYYGATEPLFRYWVSHHSGILKPSFRNTCHLDL